MEETREEFFKRFTDSEDNMRLIMDGSVILVDTQGHSRGHQSVAVNLENTGKVLLICDAASLR